MTTGVVIKITKQNKCDNEHFGEFILIQGSR